MNTKLKHYRYINELKLNINLDLFEFFYIHKILKATQYRGTNLSNPPVALTSNNIKNSEGGGW